MANARPDRTYRPSRAERLEQHNSLAVLLSEQLIKDGAGINEVVMSLAYVGSTISHKSVELCLTVDPKKLPPERIVRNVSIAAAEAKEFKEGGSLFNQYKERMEQKNSLKHGTNKRSIAQRKILDAVALREKEHDQPAQKVIIDKKIHVAQLIEEIYYGSTDIDCDVLTYWSKAITDLLPLMEYVNYEDRQSIKKMLIDANLGGNGNVISFIRSLLRADYK